MEAFSALQSDVGRKYGTTIKALGLTNREYNQRFQKLAIANNMKPPPGSNIHIMPGYLVVRRLGLQGQYETWMPDHVFDELYVKLGST